MSWAWLGRTAVADVFTFLLAALILTPVLKFMHSKARRELERVRREVRAAAVAGIQEQMEKEQK